MAYIYDVVNDSATYEKPGMPGWRGRVLRRCRSDGFSSPLGEDQENPGEGKQDAKRKHCFGSAQRESEVQAAEGQECASTENTQPRLTCVIT